MLLSVHPSALRSGKHYGCIVRKKVVLLEELKRDTSEFGGFDRTSVSACVYVCCLMYYWQCIVCYYIFLH